MSGAARMRRGSGTKTVGRSPSWSWVRTPRVAIVDPRVARGMVMVRGGGRQVGAGRLFVDAQGQFTGEGAQGVVVEVPACIR
jgi:hypothetical protein